MALKFDDYFDIILHSEQEIVDRMAEVVGQEIERTHPERWHNVMLESVERSRQKERTIANQQRKYDATTSTFHLQITVPDDTPAHVKTIFEVVDDSNKHRGDGKGRSGLYTHPGEETYTENLEDGETHHSPERYKQRHMSGWEREGQMLIANIDQRLNHDPIIGEIEDRMQDELLQYVCDH